MVKLGDALTILLSTTVAHSVWGFSVHNVLTRPTPAAIGCSLNVAATPTAYVDGEPNILSNATVALGSLSDAVTDAVNTEDDVEEIELAKRIRKVRLRAGSYKVVFPIKDNNDVLGLSLRQVEPGRIISDAELDLDSSLTDARQSRSEWQVVEQLEEKIEESYRGLIVHGVKPDGIAWRKGVRPGDLLISTSATLGDSLWPKSTLAGVKSALQTRKRLTKEFTVEFQRVIEKVDNKYELTLSRPLGFLIKDSEEGFVEVTGVKDTASTLVKYAVRVGDRVVAVESALGGRLWPVSTADGVISACTSRMPGKPITLRFERPKALLEEESEIAENGLSNDFVKTGTKESSAAVAETKPDDQVLLKRCRQTLRRYTKEDNSYVRSRVLDKFSLPALVADKVMDALMAASVSVDAKTLQLVMGAYLSCGNAQGAIRAFEFVTGLNGNGSVTAPTLEPRAVSEGEAGSESMIVPNEAALNLYTVSSLLQSHASSGDIQSSRRVLAALEGQSEAIIDGMHVEKWPGSLEPDTHIYNIVMSAGTNQGGEEGLSLALDIYQRLDEAGGQKVVESGKPCKDVVSYNTIISALTRNGLYEEAFVEFTKMKQAGVKPDKYTYTTLLNACVKDGDLVELLYDMQEKGVKADIITYNTVIKSLCEDGNLVEARNIISQMEGQGVSPDSRTYGLLMNGLLQARKAEACLTLFEAACADIRTAALTENVHLYTTAITAAGIMKDHERALDLVNRMNGIGVKPNLKTLTSVMGACLASDRPDYAAQLFDKIKNPDGYALLQGVRALCGTGDIERASTLLRNEPHRGRERRLSGKQMMSCYETILETALMNEDYNTARVLINDLLKKGNIPSSHMISTMIAGMGFVTKKGIMAVTKEECDTKKFGFLLFLLDSLRNRNLPSDGSLYAATIVCGNGLGGLYRKIVSLLKDAREKADTKFIMKSDASQTKTGETEAGKKAVDSSDKVVIGWEDLVQQYEKDETPLTNTGILPLLSVRVAKRDARKVFKAEMSVI